MKKQIFVAILFAMILMTSHVEAHWVETHVERLSAIDNLQILQNENLPDQLLDRAITREEFFSLIAVAKGFNGSGTNKTFEDLSTVTPQYAKYIGEFINEGIIVGVTEKGKNYIKPKTLTR